MNHTINLHPDFKSIKGMPTPTKRLPLALMNSFLSGVNALSARKYKGLITKRQITGAGGQRIPLLIIRSQDLPALSPALIYYHGGAFIFKHAPAHLDNAVRYAREAQCAVVFVDYRLAPKHPFPAGFNDCYAALLWAVRNAKQLGIDPQRIAVGGDSAGGAIAAAAAQRAAHEDKIDLCGQLLIYPVTDSSDHWPSLKAYADVPPFKALEPNAMWDTYLGHPLSEGTPAYAAPLQGDLSGVAPAYVETAEFCPLVDQDNAYAEALRAKGIRVTVNATKGTVHGFDLLAPKSEVSRAAVAARIGFLRACLRLD